MCILWEYFCAWYDHVAQSVMSYLINIRITSKILFCLRPLLFIPRDIILQHLFRKKIYGSSGKSQKLWRHRMVNQHAERRGSAIGRLTRERLFCGQIRKLSAVDSKARPSPAILAQTGRWASAETSGLSSALRRPLWLFIPQLHNLERAERYALNESSSGAGGETPSCRKPLHGQSCFTSRAPSRFNGGPGRVPVRLTDNHERRWTGTEAAPALSAFSSLEYLEPFFSSLLLFFCGRSRHADIYYLKRQIPGALRPESRSVDFPWHHHHHHHHHHRRRSVWTGRFGGSTVDGNPRDLRQDSAGENYPPLGFWRSRRVSVGNRICSRGSVGGTMADDDVLFEDVYELCEVIGKWVIESNQSINHLILIGSGVRRFPPDLFVSCVVDILWLLGSADRVCVCVCVWVRERERER